MKGTPDRHAAAAEAPCSSLGSPRRRDLALFQLCRSARISGDVNDGSRFDAFDVRFIEAAVKLDVEVGTTGYNQVDFAAAPQFGGDWPSYPFPRNSDLSYIFSYAGPAFASGPRIVSQA